MFSITPAAVHWTTTSRRPVPDPRRSAPGGQRNQEKSPKDVVPVTSIAPQLGLNPVTPQQWGMRIDPPVSEPSATTLAPHDTATAEPDEEPPEIAIPGIARVISDSIEARRLIGQCGHRCKTNARGTSFIEIAQRISVSLTIRLNRCGQAAAAQIVGRIGEERERPGLRRTDLARPIIPQMPTIALADG
jgi:hypothetical protein